MKQLHQESRLPPPKDLINIASQALQTSISCKLATYNEASCLNKKLKMLVTVLGLHFSPSSVTIRSVHPIKPNPRTEGGQQCFLHHPQPNLQISLLGWFHKPGRDYKCPPPIRPFLENKLIKCR